ncbi:transposase [Thermodesulfobacterium sp. TA1]|uniref:transposase n=1 Tax=Thermodesulfobacterium sp. TA1 TaxID=2234087 RepID=UPI001231E214|nr:transposase [Thermodesulfobacterium sp. TA1]QER41876.1 transposase [Thermodesulfobacterium sp. TA1]
MKQRKWTAEEKLAIVLEELKEKRSVADICRGIKSAKPYITDGGINFLRLAKKNL